MFLDILTPDQQILFMSAARAVVDADRESPEAEQDLMDALLAECGLEVAPEALTLEATIERLDAAFADGPHQRNAFMLELAGVAAIDGDLHGAELSVLRDLSGAAGLSPAQLEQFFEFGLKARQLLAEGEAPVASDAEVS